MARLALLGFGMGIISRKAHDSAKECMVSSCNWYGYDMGAT